MKKILLSLFCLTFFSSIAQTDIDDFLNATPSSYDVVSATPAIDQTLDGANVTWTFNALTKSDDASDAYTTPTAMEMSTYPGTTMVSTTTIAGGDDVTLFIRDIASALSFTGGIAEGLTLNYSTDNAFIGTFPLSYLDTNGGDAISGSFTFTGGTAGTFTGTITTEVDAYGTLTLNDVGSGAYSGTVTRLKLVQNLTLMATTPLPLTTGATQTAYFYYDSSNGNLVFRTNQVVVPLLSVDRIRMESLSSSTLKNDTPIADEMAMKISPNPVREKLNLFLKEETLIKTIEIFDITGRQVLMSSTKESSIDVKDLDDGIYIAKVETDKGTIARRFIKN